MIPYVLPMRPRKDSLKLSVWDKQSAIARWQLIRSFLTSFFWTFSTIVASSCDRFRLTVWEVPGALDLTQLPDQSQPGLRDAAGPENLGHTRYPAVSQHVELVLVTSAVGWLPRSANGSHDGHPAACCGRFSDPIVDDSSKYHSPGRNYNPEDLLNNHRATCGERGSHIPANRHADPNMSSNIKRSKR